MDVRQQLTSYPMLMSHIVFATTPVFLIRATGKISDLRVPCFSTCRLSRLLRDSCPEPILPTGGHVAATHPRFLRRALALP
jgi:hypothetical protein